MASFLLSNLNAQVTIGSRLVPESGAILDLKQEGETVKGLGLPRVKLHHLTIPQGQTSLSSTIVGASGNWGAEEHTGLVIYNLGEVCDFLTFPSGPYVWDGKEWQPLSSEGRSTDVGVFFDERGEGVTYHYRKFGEAGTVGLV